MTSSLMNLDMWRSYQYSVYVIITPIIFYHPCAPYRCVHILALLFSSSWHNCLYVVVIQSELSYHRLIICCISALYVYFGVSYDYRSGFEATSLWVTSTPLFCVALYKWVFSEYFFFSHVLGYYSTYVVIYVVLVHIERFLAHILISKI